MKTVILEESGEAILVALRNMMDGLSSTHRILERYAPAEILQTMQKGRNPLSENSSMTERVVIFADILASTTLTEVLPAETMALLLADYYEIANAAIVESGGTISKLTGDGLMAHFETGKADSALDASIRIIHRINDLRSRAESHDPRKFLYSGIGISAGRVLEGSIGSDLRKDYTLLGDPVNSAARLESVTRKTGHAIVFDSRFRSLLRKERTLKKLGRYLPKGKTDQLQIFTIPEDAIKFHITSESLRKSIQSLSEPARL